VLMTTFSFRSRRAFAYTTKSTLLVLRSATKRKPTYLRDHATPYERLSLPHSPTPRTPIRRIARPPKPQLSLRSDSREIYARAPLPATSASVNLGFYYLSSNSNCKFVAAISLVLTVKSLRSLKMRSATSLREQSFDRIQFKHIEASKALLMSITKNNVGKRHRSLTRLCWCALI
jgi:hypothetical protein